MKDRFGRKIDYLRLSITDNCNLRCIYCMEENEQKFLSKDSILTDEEIVRTVRASAKNGIKKIRLTGGEPLVRKSLVDLVGKIKEIEGIEEIYLTTNGILLKDKVEALVKNGLKGVNISLDSLNKDRFKKLTRKGDLNKVLEAIDKCIASNLEVKLNTVIVDDINKEEILDFVELTLHKPIDVRFIELMPIGTGKTYKGLSNEEVLDIIKTKYSYNNEVRLDEKGGPAKYIKVKEAIGRVGFISAISNCFCEKCNRIRVTPEGFLKQCLHFEHGVDLRKLMREGILDADLEKVIFKTIYEKPEKHLFYKSKEGEEIRCMNEIGG